MQVGVRGVQIVRRREPSASTAASSVAVVSGAPGYTGAEWNRSANGVVRSEVGAANAACVSSLNAHSRVTHGPHENGGATSRASCSRARTRPG